MVDNRIPTASLNLKASTAGMQLLFVKKDPNMKAQCTCNAGKKLFFYGSRDNKALVFYKSVT